MFKNLVHVAVVIFAVFTLMGVGVHQLNAESDRYCYEEGQDDINCKGRF